MQPYDDEYIVIYTQVTSIFTGYEISQDRAQYVADKLRSMTGIEHTVKYVDLSWTVLPVEEHADE